MSAKNVNKAMIRKTGKSTPKVDPVIPTYTISADTQAHLVNVRDSELGLVDAKFGVLESVINLMVSMGWTMRTEFNAIVESLGTILVDAGLADSTVKAHITRFNNAWKIAQGGTKGDVIVQGFGVACLREYFAGTYTSVVEFGKALSDGKPEALKPAGSTRGANVNGKKPAKTAKPIVQSGNIVAIKNDIDALKAASQILGMVTKFLKPSDHALLEAINKCVSLIGEREARETKPLAKAA